MNSSYALGFVVGIAVAALAIWAIFLFRRKQGKAPMEYDERQRAIRGDVFKHAFLVMIGWSVLYFLLVTALERPLMTDGLSGIVGLSLGILVVGVESILRDAFFTTGSRPKGYVILYIVVTLCQLPSAILNWKDMVQDGVLTLEAMPLIWFVVFLAVLCALVLKLTRREPEED